MSRDRAFTLRLTPEEHEWLRRKAHWEGTAMSEVLRSRLRFLIADTGYLRPPDDEPQDFGAEKEQMQFVVGVQSEISED